MQARDADQHAGDQLAQDGGQLKPHHSFGDGAAGHEDHQKAAHLDQGFRHLELVGADLQEKGREGSMEGESSTNCCISLLQLSRKTW